MHSNFLTKVKEILSPGEPNYTLLVTSKSYLVDSLYDAISLHDLV